MVHSLTSQIAFCVMFAVCGFALVKGGSAERWGASIVGVAWLGEIVVSSVLRTVSPAQTIELILLAGDGALAIGLLILALRFAKVWLGVAMLMQSSELGLHGAAMADLGLSFRTYAASNNVVNYLLLALLAGATTVTWMQRVKKRRSDRLAAAQRKDWEKAPDLSALTPKQG